MLLDSRHSFINEYCHNVCIMAERCFICVQVTLHAVLQLFSFCTKPFFSCCRLLLTMAKITDVQVLDRSAVPSHSGHCVRAGMIFIFYQVSCGCMMT